MRAYAVELKVDRGIVTISYCNGRDHMSADILANQMIQTNTATPMFNAGGKCDGKDCRHKA